MTITLEELVNSRQGKRTKMVIVGKVFSMSEDGPFDYNENHRKAMHERHDRKYLLYRLQDKAAEFYGCKGIDLAFYEVPIGIPDRYLVAACVRKDCKKYKVLTENLGFVQMTKRELV